jgi:MoaA/NifB/PqqE/SkfB family radical SAM enzyme
MKTKEKVFRDVLNVILNQKKSRHLTAKKFDKFICNRLLEDDIQSSKTNHFRYLYFSSVLNTVVKNLDNYNYSKKGIKKIIKIIVSDNTFSKNSKPGERSEQFKSRYGDYPPGFIALSPTQRCNLNCTGCYASSDQTTVPTLSFTTVDKIIGEVYYVFGRRFVVISGGEPFLYKSEGKTLIDIFRKYNDIFFLVYTNGTLITREMAEKLAELGNVTPAISVEGFETETDERRGRGVYKHILNAFENLRTAGVPFGISVTATRKNCDMLLTDEFYDYYFEEQGATYMFQFQFMPIGRGKESFDLMVEPEKRIQLYKTWERLLEKKRYPVADFWNSALLTNGCIAYGRMGGYLYIDWNGNIMPCVFVPYYEDNIVDLYREGKSLVDATKSLLMKQGKKWQTEYSNSQDYNYLMPCSIRDHYRNFRENIFTEVSKPENRQAAEALVDESYYQLMDEYDSELEKLSRNQINVESVHR